MTDKSSGVSESDFVAAQAVTIRLMVKIAEASGCNLYALSKSIRDDMAASGRPVKGDLQMTYLKAFVERIEGAHVRRTLVDPVSGKLLVDFL